MSYSPWSHKESDTTERLSTAYIQAVIWGFPGGSDGKEFACNMEDLGSIPGSGRSPGEGNDYPLQISCLENSMERGYSPWGHKESCTTEQPTRTAIYIYVCQL